MKKIWIGAAIFMIMMAAGCGRMAEKTQYAGEIKTVSIDGNPVLSYRVDGKVVLPVDELPEYGFYVYHDDEAGVVFVNGNAEKAEKKKKRKYPVQDISGDAEPAGERILINGRELQGYLTDGKVCVSAELLGETLYSDLAAYGVSDYYMAGKRRGHSGELDIQTAAHKLPSQEDNIREMKQTDIFPKEVVQELRGHDFILVVQNIYYNRYQAKTLIRKFDDDGKVISLNNYLALYEITEAADFRLDGEENKIFFSGKQKGERRNFSYDVKSSAIVAEGETVSYENRCAGLTGDFLWSRETQSGLVCVIQNAGVQRIKKLGTDGGITDLSGAVTEGRGFLSISDYKLENGILTFWGETADTEQTYSMDISDGGVIVSKITAGDLPVILDGVTLQGYRIGGRDAVCVQDLIYCGFTVETQDNGAVLVKEAETLENPRNMSIAVPGTEQGEAKITAARVRLNGMTIPSYEAQGRQYLLIDDLCRFRTEYNDTWGYSDYNMRAEYGQDAIRIDLFRLGPAMEGEFERLNALVSEEELDLYTQSADKASPYFGARLEPQRGVYAGMNGDNLISEGQISCLLNYVEFDDFQTDFYSPNRSYVKNMNCICVVPWNITDLSLVFENDSYIRKTLDTFASYDKPMIIRFGAEMNISGLGDSPSGFVNAFRKVADIIHAQYPQFAVMWSMNDLGALNKPAGYYYPGDAYVDWMGISSFMKKHFGAQVDMGRDGNVFFMTGDFAYHTNTVKNILSFMEENGIQKPVAISEGGTVTKLHYPGGGEIRQWSETRMRNLYWYLPMRYPQVKIIDYFNHDTPNETQTYDISFSSNLRNIFDQATTAGIYLKHFGDSPAITFTRAEGTQTDRKQIPLYGYVYIPEADVEAVSYILDDSRELARCTQIPYHFVLDCEQIPQGEHKITMNVESSNEERKKEYKIINEQGKIKIEIL